MTHYLHGTEPIEQHRLGLMNELLNANSLREMNLAAGDRVLDVGCGLGQLSREMARQVGPTGRVVGIERSAEQLESARELARQANEDRLVEFREGPADPLPLGDDEWGTFDVAHARFLLEHVPDPVAIVRQMVRAVRPGGRIVLQDDPHDTLRLWPEPAAFGKLWASYMRTYDRVGNDPLVGHRLVAILVQAGAQPTKNAWPFFGACAGQPERLRDYVENLARILEGVRAPILSLGEFDAPSFEGCLAELRAWAKRPDAAFWYAVSYAEGTRPLSNDSAKISVDQR
jgi:ubiquinone/menaquinone biosynthesis C-methylase UbiE